MPLDQPVERFYDVTDVQLSFAHSALSSFNQPLFYLVGADLSGGAQR